MPEHELFEEGREKKIHLKKDVAKGMSPGGASASLPQRVMGSFLVDVGKICVSFSFHFKEEWAFSMQLKICLSTTL